MMTDEKPTIFIIDDDPSARRGLSRLVRAAGMYVEAYDSAQKFLERKPDCVHGCILLDVKMPRMGGLELQAELVEVECGLPIIFISGHADIPTAALAMKKGAVDFLTKPVEGDQLLRVISESLARDLENRETQSLQTEARARIATLSPREYEVMTFVIAGLFNKQIAFELGIVEDTVKIHRARVMKKLRAESLPALVRLADLANIKPAEPQKT